MEKKFIEIIGIIDGMLLLLGENPSAANIARMGSVIIYSQINKKSLLSRNSGLIWILVGQDQYLCIKLVCNGRADRCDTRWIPINPMNHSRYTSVTNQTDS